MSITSKQLAELAGVSRGTVDRALNHRGGVRPSVQQRIEELARKYNYRPNRAGKALVMRDTLNIGIIINSVGNPFFDEVKRGLEAAKADYSDFSINLNWHEEKGYDVERQLKQIEDISEMSGTIITPINHPDIAERLNHIIQGKKHPVITLNNDINNCARFAYVGCNYFQSGQTAGQIMGLLTNGNARILAVTGSKKVLGHNQRLEGFIGVLKSDYPKTRISGIIENNDDDDRSAYEVARAIAGDSSIDALYFCAGGVTGGVYAAVSQCRKKPVIVTCDLTEGIQKLIREGLVQATVDQQPYWQGYTSMKVLLDYLLFHVVPESDLMYARNEIRVKYNI
jgi:LacI family transcriptional regulator